MNRPGILPTRLALVTAVAAIAAALLWVVSAETPVGKVSGQILLQETGRPLPGVRVNLRSQDGKVSRGALTGRDGRFLLTLPVGPYELTAFTQAHSSRTTTIWIAEARTSALTVRLTRSRPDLQLARHDRVVATSAEATLPVMGYVHGAGAPRTVLQLRVYRARLSTVLGDAATAAALRRVGDYWRPGAGLPEPILRMAQPVVSREVVIRDADIEGFFHTQINLGRLEAGVYLIEVGRGGASVTTWLHATDLGLVMKRAGDEILAYAVDLESGVPAPGTRVEVFRGNERQGAWTTDGRGIARIQIAESRDQLLLVASRGEDEAVVGLRDYGFEEDGDHIVHLYTDRTIYRPGHRVYYKAIVRRKTGTALRYAVPVSEPIRLELRDPNGQTVLVERNATGSSGSFFGEVMLSEEAPTGIYSWIVTVAGEHHTEDLFVAAYRKPEFTVTVAPADTTVVRGDEVRFDVSAEYFFGAPVAGAKIEYAVYRVTDWAYEYADDFFADEGDLDALRSYGGYGRITAEGTAELDGQGRAAITVRADSSGDPVQAERWSVVVSVTEASGRTASGEAAVRVIAGEVRVLAAPEGYIGFPGHPAGLVVTVTDADDHRRMLAGIPVEVEYGLEEWDAAARTRRYEPLGVLRATTGGDGRARIEVTPSRPGSLRITARAQDAAGRPVVTQTHLWIVDERGEFGAAAQAPTLSVLTDKRQYRPGETARIAVNTDRTGQTALVTVESDRIHVVRAVPLKRRTTLLELPVLAEYGPNVHLSALYVRDGRLAYSGVPLRVSIAARELAVEITTDRPSAGPGESVSYRVRVSDASGRPVQAEVSLGIVDEAIYALREDDPQALRRAFYPSRDSAVRTEFSGSVQYLGEGAEKDAPDVAVRRRFPDTAAWFPALRTDARGEAAVTVTLPDNLTTWRATAVAHTPDTLIGRGVGSLVVTKPFLVRLDTSRFLVAGDRTRMLALVHNNTDAPQVAVVRLEAGPLRVEGSAERTVSVAPGQIAELPWLVMIPEEPGKVSVRVLAWTEDRRYTDGLEATLAVRPHGRELFWTRSGEMTGGTTAETFAVSPAADLRSTRLVVRITPSITTSLVGALDYLFDYPYGCIEQTMGRFVPDVVASRILRDAGIRAPQMEERTRDMVRDGLTRIYRAQNENGSWGWFFYDQTDPWMTAYVLYGLSLAREHGYEVDETVLTRGRKAAAAVARTPQLPADVKAFLLYALARAGDAETARAERKAMSPAGLSSEALAYVVLLDTLLGNDPRPAFEALERGAIREEGLIHWETSRETWNWDRRMVTAAALRAMLAVDPRDARIVPVLRWLMLARTGEYWESTRATAWVVLALTDYLRLYPETEGPGEIRATVNGRVVGSFPMATAVEGQPEIVLNIPGDALQKGVNQLVLERTAGSSRIFYSAFLHQTVPMDEIPADDSAGISIEREYLRVRQEHTGQRWAVTAEPSGNRLSAGDNVRVRLTVRVARELAYVLIEDPLPAGFEVTDRMFNGDFDYYSWTYWWAAADARDDRIAFFIPRLSAGTHTLEYTARASTPGVYRVLPTTVQPMYAPQLRGESAGATVEVRE